MPRLQNTILISRNAVSESSDFNISHGKTDSLISGVFLECEDQYYIMLTSSVGIDITSVGIVYGKNIQNKIVLRNCATWVNIIHQVAHYLQLTI